MQIGNNNKLLVSATEAAKMLDISRSHFYSSYSAGLWPMAIRIGSRVLWRVEELQDYVRAGCPNREKWEWEKKV